jgi:hypothetical protein
VLTVHVALKEVLPMTGLAELKNQIRSMLKDEEVPHATIEFETLDEPCVLENCL